MHTEHLQNVRVMRVVVAWLIAVAIAALVYLAFAALGLAPEDTPGAAAAIAAVAVGFGAGGFVAGFRAMHAPILHGIALGLASLVAWFVLNVIAVGLLPQQASWTGLSAGIAAGLLLEQMVVGVAGAWAGYRSALQGQPEPDEE